MSDLGFLLIFNSILLGIGLAMDAFSVSLANGLNEPKMKFPRVFLIAGTFAVFQFLMPLIGWLLVHTVAKVLLFFEKIIPYIALALLLAIGGKMLFDGIKENRSIKKNKKNDVIGDDEAEENKNTEKEKALVKGLSFSALIVQGIATSIDALSVGFTISDHNFKEAFGASLIIGIVTLIICIFGLFLGKKFGTKLAGKASILGGLILIGIGIEIFVKGVFF